MFVEMPKRDMASALMGFGCSVGFLMGFKFLDDNFRGRGLCELDCFI